MTLISLEIDQITISNRFRKADYFAFLDKNKITIEKNEHKLSKSNEFFDYFNDLNIKKIYLKSLGYKTFLKLEKLGISVYFVNNRERFNEIEEGDLSLINHANAKLLCTLGHRGRS